MGKEVYTRIERLRKHMAEVNADWFFATSDDFHASEYVADYFKVREYYTGFTGENAFLLLNKSEAFMWTDGRFFIQAPIELEGSGVSLMKMGEEGVPTVSEYILKNVKKGESFYADGRMVSTSYGKSLEEALNKVGARFVYDKDLGGDCFLNRPSLPSSKLIILNDEITGESFKEKLNRIREALAKEGAGYNFLGSIDDIAWITNMRGADVACNPVFLSYMLITMDEAYIFMQDSEVSKEVRDYLESNNVIIKDYSEVIDFLLSYDFKGKVLCDEASVNFTCFKALEKKADLVKAVNPSKMMKAVKNETEIKRLKEAYLEDSVCVTKFIYWLKKNIGKTEISELSAAKYLDALRSKVPGFMDLSFPTISGYKTNGAIVHYGVTEESNAALKPEGMLLVDSGGQYEKGTTDVTRTVKLGDVPDKAKVFYTKVAASMLNLADAKFLYGCTGRNLDTIARLPLWELGYDYKHGTGHGVGYILNVHEGPQAIRWQYNKKNVEYVFEPGMITSDEPGAYFEGEFGIRIENIILCCKDKENEFGKFLKFEHLTYVPLDRDLIDKSLLSEKEISLYNSYQASVYDKLKDLLTDEEAEWLKEETEEV